ncbi:Uncharacterised protein [Mycobacterium tuberculosis]|nr:Uncharacterised protein [Mycobacterium tuberculosis]
MTVLGSAHRQLECAGTPENELGGVDTLAAGDREANNTQPIDDFLRVAVATFEGRCIGKDFLLDELPYRGNDLGVI